MAVKIENGIITADTKEELEQSLREQWSEICDRASLRAAENAVRIQRWNAGVEMVNHGLLAVAAALILMCPFGCLMIIELNALANAYITSIGV